MALENKLLVQLFIILTYGKEYKYFISEQTCVWEEMLLLMNLLILCFNLMLKVKFTSLNMSNVQITQYRVLFMNCMKLCLILYRLENYQMIISWIVPFSLQEM